MLKLYRTSVDNCEYEGRYNYDEKLRLTSSAFGSQETEITYDDLDRIATYTLSSGNQTILDKSYVYGTNGTCTTNRVVQITDNNENGINSTARYDANGYITRIGYGYQSATYGYDRLGRIVSEANNYNNVSYEYDGANNVAKKTVDGVQTNYTYNDKNQLTQVGTQTFAYDEMGNPTTYKGNTFVWEQGRKLASGSMNGKSFSYRYDGNGMRYKKTVGMNTTEYYLDGSQILAEYRSENKSRIVYIYDASGIAGMIYKEQYYFYEKNTLGDIVGIYNESGNKVGEYVYDAWGNILYKSGSMADINPFRYRGYYYDTETGFYYLQTRYYDPTICRFINADNYELVSQLASSKELNMYAYCNNNPIMLTDETGEGLIIALILIGGAIAGGIYNGVKSYNEGNDAGQIILDVFIGAGAGLAIAGGIMMLGGVGTIAFQSISGMIGVSASLAQMTALGTAAFNLGGFIMAALQGIKTPEPVEFPSQPQAPTYYTPITGY